MTAQAIARSRHVPVKHAWWYTAGGVLPMLGRVAMSPLKAAKRVEQLVYRWTHRPEHLQYLRLLRTARRRGIASGGALIRMKYLGTYLAAPFTIEQRRDALAAHYRFLVRLLPPAGARAWQDATLWERIDADGHTHRIRLEAATLSPMEGESQLCVMLDGVTLSTLTFAVVEGGLVGSGHRYVLFVGGVQGGVDCREEMRAAARANGEIAATAMALIAARALADVLDAGPIVGVAGHQHAAVGYVDGAATSGYDRMWQEAGAVQTRQGFYLLDPAAAAAEPEPTGKHRARTRRKRALKAELLAEFTARTGEVLGLASD